MHTVIHICRYMYDPLFTGCAKCELHVCLRVILHVCKCDIACVCPGELGYSSGTDQPLTNLVSPDRHTNRE